MYPIELFVARDVLYAAKQGGSTIADVTEINELVTGGIALFTENNVLINAATTAAQLKSVSQFRIAINDGNGVRLSVPIDREAYNATKQGYVAPVNQVVVVGESAGGNGSLNYPTLAAGQIAELVVTDRTTGDHRPGLTKRYYANVTDASTAATITTDLIAAVNDDPTSIVTATAVSGNVGIILTSKVVTTSFVVGVDEILASTTIWNDGTNGSALINLGQGSVRHLLELQDESDILLGKSASGGQQQYWWSRVDDVTASGIAGFEMWIFQHATESRVAGNVKNVATVNTALAYPTGTTATTGIEDVLEGILDVVLKGTESSSGATPVEDN